MTTMLDLMQVFHDIDHLKGRTCGACEFFRWRISAGWKRPMCALGCKPLSAGDGCDEWADRSRPAIGEAA
jgi:hypothetical protein